MNLKSSRSKLRLSLKINLFIADTSLDHLNDANQSISRWNERHEHIARCNGRHSTCPRSAV
jgi:hypothetical protein